MKRLLSTAALLALSGCAMFSHNDPFMQVQPGMEAAQVQSLLGSPVDRKFVGDHDEWTYRREMGRGIQKTKVIVFDNQKVVALADDAVAAEREFELAKARVSATQYGVPGPNGQPVDPATGKPAQPGAPNPALTAGSPMVLPPGAQSAQVNNAIGAPNTPQPQFGNQPQYANQPQQPVAPPVAQQQPQPNPSVGMSSAVAAPQPAPPAPATDAANPAPPADQAKPQAAVPPSSELAPAPQEKKVVQQKAKKSAKKAKKHAKAKPKAKPLNEPHNEEAR